MPSVERRSRSRGLHFEVHRTIEYLLGFALVSFGISMLQAPIVAVGCALVALAAVTRGRLGLRGWLSPAVHRAFDVVLIGVTAVAPLAAPAHPGLAAAVLEPCAAVLLLLLLRTDHRARGTEPVAPVPEPQSIPGLWPDQEAVEEAARRAGQLAGQAVRAGRDAVRGRAADPDADLARDVGRSLGRLTGRLRVAARRAREREEPPSGK